MPCRDCTLRELCSELCPEAELIVAQNEVTQKELQTIAGTLTKMVLLLEENKISDANIPKESIIIEEYKKTLSKYLGPNFENELKNDNARAKGN